MMPSQYEPMQEYLLRLGDNALILGQRLSEWCGHAPMIEEDIALTNIALDLIGQARLLLSYAAKREGQGRDEDAIAFLRNETEYRNLTIVELPNGDFGQTVLRNFLFTTYQIELWLQLLNWTDAHLAAIAEKSVKESRYHQRYSADWVVRLGDGTAESHQRMQNALQTLWPYVTEMFTDDSIETTLAGVVPLSSTLHNSWTLQIQPVLDEAKLMPPETTAFVSRGKFGLHSEMLGHILSEMQYLQRAYPGGVW